MSPPAKLLAGVELGGTKCVCILGSGPDDVRAMERLPTVEREATLRAIESLLDRWRAEFGPPHALGIASFGPVDLAPASPTWGYITSTSKPGWVNTDVAQRLRGRCGVPLGLDTDVNGAALAEGRWGAARGLSDYAYVTVGTGIGVGSIVRGRSIFGMNHTELGHIRVVRLPDDGFAGVCPYHGDCIEGLASGPAIEARTGRPAAQLADDDPAWAFIVHGLAQLLHTMVLTTAPARVFIGGGVLSERPQLFERIRLELQRSLNEYVRAPELERGLAQFVVPPGLGTMAGPLGALALAADADKQMQPREIR
jgi:fructokinase